MKNVKPKGKRASEGHPWTGKPPRKRKTNGPSQLSPDCRDILERVKHATAEQAAKREGADLSSLSHLKVMIVTGPKRWRGRPQQDNDE